VTDYVSKARRIADDVLFPSAITVDRAGAVPESHFRLLADEGFYGVAAPVSVGGADLSLPDFLAVVEILAGGCLATTFTWLQHQGVVRGIAATDNNAVRDRWLPGLVRGELRAGVAFAGAIQQPPKLTAKRVDGGYLLSGEAPFVSGWHTVDMVLLSARAAEADDIVSGVLEPDGDVSVIPIQLVAAQGTDTVRLMFNDYEMPDEAITTRVTRTEFLGGQVFGSRVNGTVPLGITARCIRLLAESGHHDLATTLTTQLDTARARMDAALDNPPAMPAARAATAELAYRAAGTLVAATGSTGITTANDAQRLAREATFTLVAAGRPDIRTELISLLINAPTAALSNSRPDRP
jgi:alkylation response protein AidB-like acyl-CoA dehydrogenase